MFSLSMCIYARRAQQPHDININFHAIFRSTGSIFICSKCYSPRVLYSFYLFCFALKSLMMFRTKNIYFGMCLEINEFIKNSLKQWLSRNTLFIKHPQHKLCIARTTSAKSRVNLFFLCLIYGLTCNACNAVNFNSAWPESIRYDVWDIESNPYERMGAIDP